MSPTPSDSSRILHGLDEHFAAGYMEEPDASPVCRWSRAVRRRFEHRAVPSFGNDLLYPSGPVHIGEENRLVSPTYSFTWSWNATALEERLESATPEERDALAALRSDLRELDTRLELITTVHTVGGRGYTHSVPNYGRVLREGLDAHAERVAGGLEAARESGDATRVDLYLGLQDVLAGIRAWHGRLCRHLGDLDLADPFASGRRDALLAALERVPLQPARSFFEAVVAYNFVYYLDDCDNPGRVDQELFPFYERDLAAHRVTHDDAVLLIGCLWANCDTNGGWSAGIGGTNAKVWEMEIEDWRRVVDIDLTGTFLCCRAVVPRMIEGGYGRIVNIASIAGKEGNPLAAHYSAAKAGVIGFTKSLGKECVGTGVIANCIAPAVIETAILKQNTPEQNDYLISKIPMGRVGQPEEVAALIAWLSSEDCSFSTGAVYDISGGRATY